MLRRGRFKFIHYEGFSPELFDLEADPEEESDLSKDPGCDSLLREFESILHGIVDPQEADRRAKADQAALVERHGGRDAVLSQRGYFGSPTPGD